MVDTDGYKAIDQAAQMTKDAVESGKWSRATTLWSFTEGVIARVTNNIDFYNILTKMEPVERKRGFIAERLLSEPTFAEGNNLKRCSIYANL